MKNIAILVPETAVIEAVADPRYMFTAVNEFIKSQGKPALFNVQLVGLTKEVKLADLVLPGRRIDVPAERVQVSGRRAGVGAAVTTAAAV